MSAREASTPLGGLESGRGARSAGIVRGLVAGREVLAHLLQDPLQVGDQLVDDRNGGRIDFAVAAQVLRPKLTHRRSREDDRSANGPGDIDRLPHVGDALGAHESTQYVSQFGDTIGKDPGTFHRQGANVAPEQRIIVGVA